VGQRVIVPNDVAFGQQVTFNFTITAPSTPGNYDFKWQMLQESVKWFGDYTPTVTVAVCTRDRPDDLARCLDAIQALNPPPDQIVVVDNAPSTNDTRLLVIQRPGVRYVREPRPGLDWARNRAICESTSDIVAFTDDDVVVDPLWVGALKRTFADFPEAMAVTGLVLPHELETAAQLQFEEYGGFGRGFERRVYRVDQAHGERAVAEHGGTGKFGTGANMAFRKTVFAEIGDFDPALDVGTVTNGGGDLDMFFRVLRSGHTLVYEPAALVRHRHRRDRGQLVRQIANNGTLAVAAWRASSSS